MYSSVRVLYRIFEVDHLINLVQRPNQKKKKRQTKRQTRQPAPCIRADRQYTEPTPSAPRPCLQASFIKHPCLQPCGGWLPEFSGSSRQPIFPLPFRLTSTALSALPQPWPLRNGCSPPDDPLPSTVLISQPRWKKIVQSYQRQSSLHHRTNTRRLTQNT